jgi:hypothetical protein
MIRNKLRYLLLLVLVGLLSILYNEYYMSIIFLTLAAMPILMFVLLYYLYRKVTAESISEVHVSGKGERIPISVQINNPTIFPIVNLKICLTYNNAYSPIKYKKEYLVSVDARTKTSVLCQIRSEYAGNLEISLKAIRIYDYLRLLSLKRKLTGEIKVAVLPVFYELPENEMESRNSKLVESDYYSAIKSGDDPSEVFSIREYREGDRLQRIHWKLSRKQGQLMIKEFSDPLNCSVLLFVDLGIADGGNILLFMDSILECALSLSYSFLSRGQMHYFSWYDEKHGACRRIRVVQEKDFYEVVDGLLQALPFTKATDAMHAYLSEHPNDQYSNLFYVTGDASGIQFDSLAALKAYNRQLIYVCDNGKNSEEFQISDEMIRQSQEMGLDLWPIDSRNVRRDMEQRN